MKKIFQATTCLSVEELELYTNGKVSDELRHKIENHLIDCPLCADATEGYAAIETAEDDTLENLYQSIDAKVDQQDRTVRAVRIPWNRIAAGILFIISVGAAYWYYQSNQADQFYQAYFDQSRKSLAIRGVSDIAQDASLQLGTKLYAEENYQGSLSFFEDYLKENKESTVATYYAGLSALNAGELQMAYEFLSTVRLNDDRLYEEATWALVEVHLKKKEVDAAKGLLTDLTKLDGGIFKDQAEQLLNEMAKE